MSAISYLAHCPLGPPGNFRNEWQIDPGGTKWWRMWWLDAATWRPGPWCFRSWWQR